MSSAAPRSGCNVTSSYRRTAPDASPTLSASPPKAGSVATNGPGSEPDRLRWIAVRPATRVPRASLWMPADPKGAGRGREINPSTYRGACQAGVARAQRQGIRPGPSDRNNRRSRHVGGPRRSEAGELFFSARTPVARTGTIVFSTRDVVSGEFVLYSREGCRVLARDPVPRRWGDVPGMAPGGAGRKPNSISSNRPTRQQVLPSVFSECTR